MKMINSLALKIALGAIGIALLVFLGVQTQRMWVERIVSNSKTYKDLVVNHKQTTDRLIDISAAYRKLSVRADSLADKVETLQNEINALTGLKTRLEAKVTTYTKYNKVCYQSVWQKGKGFRRGTWMNVEVPCKD